MDIEPQVLSQLRTIYDDIGQHPVFWHWPAPLPPELREWGERWHLTDPWCHEWARKCFAEWSVEQEGHRLVIRQETHSFEALVASWRATPGFGFAIVKEIPDEPPFPPGYMGSIGPLQPAIDWNTFSETEADFRVRAVSELGEYIQRSRAAALAGGARPTPALKRIEDHLLWLVRFQVRGELMSDIWRHSVEGEEGGKSYHKFQKAIRRAAARIDLTLRH